MAYTTPPTFVAGTELAADDLNLLGDDIVYLKAQADLAVLSGTRASRVTTQSIPNNTATPISFTVETFDQGGWIAVTSTTFTVPAGAIPSGYTTVALDVRVGVNFAANATGYRKATVTQNGSPVLAPQVDASTTSVNNVNESTILTAVAGDTFQVEAYQNSGGALNIGSAYLILAVFKPVS